MDVEEEILFDSESFERMKQEWVLLPTQSPRRKRCCGLKKRVLWTVGVVSIVILTTVLAKVVPRHHATPLHQDQYAQKSGALPAGNNVTWRQSSCMRDGVWPVNFHLNLSGGYFDGGDSVKSNLPTSFAMTMLTWSVIEYRSKYEVAGELTHVQGLIKWGTDFFLNTFLSEHDTINTMVSQIGSRGSGVPDDDYCWMRPEDIDYPRPVKLCLNDCPPLAAEMSAALASASIVFKDVDMIYSERLIHGAKTLYKFAQSSSSMSRQDSLLWGGAWLYYATGDADFLERVTSEHLAKKAGAFSSSATLFGLESKVLGAQLLLTRLRIFLSPPYPYEDMLRKFHNQTGVLMCSYLPSFSKRTKGGLIKLDQGDLQPLEYVANAAFLATLYSDYLEASDTPGWYCGPHFYTTKSLRDFSTSQNMSYVVGFGERYPKHVHHREASIPVNKKESCKGGWRWRDSKLPNPNVIQGAMVAATDKDDGFHDVRVFSNYTEPTLVGNAGLVAALVALGEGGAWDKNDIFSSVLPLTPPPPSPPAPWSP